MTVAAGAAVCPGSAAGQGDDCDDGDPEVRPGRNDGCNGVDEDCDGATDEDGDARGDECVPPYAGSLTPTPGRWIYGGEVGVEGGRSACAARFDGAGLCTLAQIDRAVVNGELVGSRDDQGGLVRNFWVDDPAAPDGERCVRGDGQRVPWSEGDPDAATAGRGVFLSQDQDEVVASVVTNCSVPRWVACCGYPR